jgi:hypothetical protein
MQDKTTRERFRTFPTERLQEIAHFDLDMTGYAELAQQVLDEREAGYTAKKTWQDHVRDRQQDPTAHLGMLRESNLRMLAAEGYIRIDDETLETLYSALGDRLDKAIDYLDDYITAGYWTDQLWSIDRACRALGIES